MRARQWRRVFTVFGIVALLCLTAVVVSAHAQLKTADPADKATVTASPAQVTLTFSEETSATRSTGSVVDASGAVVSTGFKVDLNDRTKMTIALKPSLPNGVYTVKFHTLTEDDNGMVDGTTTFTLQAAAAAGSATTGTVPAASAVTGTGTALATRGTTATIASTAVPTATRPATSAVATGTGGATPIPTTLPQTGKSVGGAMVPWLLLIVIAGVSAVGAGLAFRSRTRRS